MTHVTHDLKSLALGFLLLIVAGFGIIAVFASVKYGIVDNNFIFIVAGVLDLVAILYGARHFFKKHLDPNPTKE